jgi:hypothetical protein
MGHKSIHPSGYTVKKTPAPENQPTIKVKYANGRYNRLLYAARINFPLPGFQMPACISKRKTTIDALLCSCIAMFVTLDYIVPHYLYYRAIFKWNCRFKDERLNYRTHTFRRMQNRFKTDCFPQ